MVGTLEGILPETEKFMPHDLLSSKPQICLHSHSLNQTLSSKASTRDPSPGSLEVSHEVRAKQ